jgi:hypothetical protein
MSQNIYTDGVLTDVNVRYWTAAIMLNAEDMSLKDTDIVDAFKLGKKLLIPQEVIHEFRAIEGRARRVVEKNSFQFPIGNARFVPRTKFAKVVKALQQCQDEYAELTNKLVENYDTYRQEMIPVYRQAAETAFVAQTPTGVQEFNLEDREQEKTEFVNKFLQRIQTSYPAVDTLRSKFSLTWDIYEIALPRMRKGDENQIIATEAGRQFAIQEYQVQMQKKIGNFLDDVVTTLRTETVALCSRVAKNIKDGKVVNSRTLKSIRDYIDQVKEMNFVGDKKVEDQLNNLQRDFLNVHSTETITSDVELQDELKRRLGDLAAVVGDMTDVNSVTGEYRRKIDLE